MNDGDNSLRVASATIAEEKQAIDALRGFVKILKKNGFDGTRWRGHPDQREALEHVFDKFDECAQLYFERAQQLLTVANAKPEDRARSIEQVLKKLRTHALVLGDIVRQPKTQAIPAKDLLIRLSSFISQRLRDDSSRYSAKQSALLLPVFSSKFYYVHFSYVDEIGIVGVPAEFVRLDSGNLTHADLTILWHEIAARVLASVQREAETLLAEEVSSNAHARKVRNDDVDSVAHRIIAVAQDLRTELRRNKRWKAYRKLYYNTLIYKLFIDLTEINSELTGPDFQKLLDKSSKALLINSNEKDERLREIRWIIELIEDYLPFLALATTPDRFEKTHKSMIRALSKRYPHPVIGDRSHPSPLLRALVALALQYCPDREVYRTKAKQLIASFPGIEENIEKNTGSVDEIDIAYDIAKVLIDTGILNGVYRQEVSPETKSIEEKLAEAIFDSEPGVGDLTDALQGYSPPVAAQDRGQNFSIFRQEIASASSINALLKIKFTYVDPFGGEPDNPPVDTSLIPPQRDTDRPS